MHMVADTKYGQMCNGHGQCDFSIGLCKVLVLSPDCCNLILRCALAGYRSWVCGDS
jgi:hypothetical protein